MVVSLELEKLNAQLLALMLLKSQKPYLVEVRNELNLTLEPTVV
jgi:hypothetical protein